MKPTAIICSDIHARYDQPKCRIDDFLETQIKKWIWLSGLQKKYGCPILCGGDLFHKSKSPSHLISLLFKYMPDKIYTVAGNHDLPDHSMLMYPESSIYLLNLTKKLNVVSGRESMPGFNIHGFAYGKPLKNHKHYGKPKNVALIHRYIYKDKNPHDIKGSKAIQVLKDMSDFDLIVTGDNHQPFIKQYKGRILVNPGSLTRQTSDQIKHKPRIYLWYAETNQIDKIYVPIDKNAVSRGHLTEIEIRNEKIELFVRKLKKSKKAGIDFKTNVDIALNKNKIRSLVKKKIKEAVYGSD